MDSLNVTEIPLPGGGVGDGQIESDTTFFVFEEFTADATVDVQTFTVGEERLPIGNNTEGTISGNFTSYTILLDTVTQDFSLAGWIEFDRDIRGIIWQVNDLEASDPIFNPVTSFSNTLRGLEAHRDEVIFTSARRVDFSLHNGANGDTLRILVDAPTPPVGALVALGAAVALRVRRQRL